MTTLSLGKIDESEEVAAVDAAAATDTWPDVASDEVGRGLVLEVEELPF
ncbi:hypothetical protein PENARI_c094G01954 [Penicillium arizonense]|uniref:Uncharacterized protein n=1 Tax=Penicillium arizonense TaxID=1835702 RepID=A0A1F5L0W3_PENAI|nr:hypothetical protein PENARI_c111G03151 [Penicillium arizonense]XP_022482355.1 hypothetical protein PENARI_c094G01954 [Penicillium arizonense]OGE46785.1 hypothetical protein PENARI_c111G03151 [Penicillium arizonense]OGE46888.1 hypothetical protein PENARI_c094G01954 [Penicillium arizonense]